MNNEYYTYLYIDPNTNVPFYVGKGKGDRAFAKHRKYVNGRIRNLGGKHQIRAMTGLTETKAFMAEKLLIAVFGRKDKGTGCLLNGTDGGDGGIPGLVYTEEYRAKLAAAKRGRKLSLETRAKMSAAAKGRKKSAEHAANISKAMKGNQHCRGRQNALGYRHTEEAKAKISLNHKSKHPDYMSKTRNSDVLESIRHDTNSEVTTSAQQEQEQRNHGRSFGSFESINSGHRDLPD